MESEDKILDVSKIKITALDMNILGFGTTLLKTIYKIFSERCFNNKVDDAVTEILTDFVKYKPVPIKMVVDDMKITIDNQDFYIEGTMIIQKYNHIKEFVLYDSNKKSILYFGLNNPFLENEDIIEYYGLDLLEEDPFSSEEIANKDNDSFRLSFLNYLKIHQCSPTSYKYIIPNKHKNLLYDILKSFFSNIKELGLEEFLNTIEFDINSDSLKFEFGALSYKERDIICSKEGD